MRKLWFWPSVLIALTVAVGVAQVNNPPLNISGLAWSPQTSGTASLTLANGTLNGTSYIYFPQSLGSDYIQVQELAGVADQLTISAVPGSGLVTLAGNYFGTILQFNNASTTVGTMDTNGTRHIGGTAPTASAGSVATNSTNEGGQITGLSTATSVAITFANSGWTNAAFCTANDSTGTAVGYSSMTKTAVTFTFASLTGTLTYHCTGN